MLDFFKSRGNLKLKIALLVYVIMLYLSVSKGISYVMVMFVLIAFFSMRIEKYLDWTAIFLMTFSLLYSLMLFLNGNTGRLLVYLFCPSVFYLFGRHVTKTFDNKALLEFLILTIFVFGLRTYIAVIADYAEAGLFNSYRMMNRANQEDSVMAATLFGLNVSLGFVGLVSYFVKSDYDIKLIKLLLLVSFASSLLTVLHLVTRTGLFVFVLCSAAMILYSSPKQGARILILLLILGVLLFLAIPSLRVFFAEANVSYQYREENELGGIFTMGDRLWRWLDACGRLFTNPFGWNGKANYNYVHNLWLDVAMFAGILPFLFIVLATIRGIKYVLRLSHLSKNIIVIILIGLTVDSFASAFMEPVLVGQDLYFYLMCMFWGIAYQYGIKLKNGIS